METPLVIDQAAYKDVIVREGDSYRIEFQFTDSDGNPLNIFGYGFQLHCRKKSKSKQPIPDISFSTSEGDFVIGPASGSIVWELDGTKTRNKAGSYLYDAELISPVNKELTTMYGQFTIVDENA